MDNVRRGRCGSWTAGALRDADDALHAADNTSIEASVRSSAQQSSVDKCLLLLSSQEFLICIEMFVAALAHAYAFPPSDYTDPLHPPHGMVSFRIIGEHALCASHALSDARACTGSMQQ